MIFFFFFLFPEWLTSFLLKILVSSVKNANAFNRQSNSGKVLKTT